MNFLKINDREFLTLQPLQNLTYDVAIMTFYEKMMDGLSVPNKSVLINILKYNIKELSNVHTM